MDFINLLIVILALCSTPITIMSGSVTNHSYSTTKSNINVALSARKVVFPPPRQLGENTSTDSKDDNLICKTCKRLSEPRTCCFNYLCVDLLTDRFNCGACGLVCTIRTRCCGGNCVNIRKDNGNCGKCNNVCSPRQKCSFGLCVDA